MKMPIPQDWDGVSWCCYVVEWPLSSSWEAILLGFLTTPMRGRFWDDTTGSIIDAQEVGQQIFTRNNVGTENCSMGCLEDLVVAINNLGVKIQNGMANSNCGCNGSGGSGITEEPASEFQDNGTAFPDGYSDYASYRAAKCDLAELTRVRAIQSLNQIRSVQTGGYSAAALAAILTPLLALPIAYIIVLELAIVILALAAIGIEVFVSAVDELISYFTDDFDICLIYEAETVDQAKTNILANINAQTFTQDELTKELAGYLITNDTLNLAFSPPPDDLNLEALPDGDCSGCDEPGVCFYTITEGSGPGYPGGDFTSELVGENEYIGLDYRTSNATGSADCPQQVVTINSISGHLAGTLVVNYLDAAGGAASDDITGDPLPKSYTTRGGPAGGAYFTINTGLNSGSHFSANITFEDWTP